MIRINTSDLRFKNNSCYYEDELFSGIGYEVNEGIINSRFIYINGEISKEYENDFFQIFIFFQLCKRTTINRCIGK